MAAKDYTDFYITTKENPRFVEYELIESEIIRVIIQKYEMILFTNKGELLGYPDFGCNLYELLYETKVSGDFVQNTINDQIQTYIPELAASDYDLDVAFTQDPERYQDMMFVYLKLSDFEVFAQIGGFN